MATPETVEIASLLAPISAEHPAGESLLYDAVYDQLKDAARGGGRSQLDADEAAAPDWKGLLQLASSTLATRSKDLQIAAWLTEALTRTHGFPGLRDGLRTLRGLLETFWDTLHPQIEDGDLEFRAGRLSYLNESSAGAARESLAAAIETLPLPHPAGGGADRHARLRERREGREGGPPGPGKKRAA